MLPYPVVIQRKKASAEEHIARTDLSPKISALAVTTLMQSIRLLLLLPCSQQQQTLIHAVHPCVHALRVHDRGGSESVGDRFDEEYKCVASESVVKGSARAGGRGLRGEGEKEEGRRGGRDRGIGTVVIVVMMRCRRCGMMACCSAADAVALAVEQSVEAKAQVAE